MRLNELTKNLADKRRLLRDEEAKFHEIERKIREKQAHERTLAERLKNEYDDLRGCFEQMAFELRFSIEDELRIYSRLLDELMKKSSTTGHTAGGGSSSSSTATTLFTSTIRSAGIDDHPTSTIFQHTRDESTVGSGLFDLASSQSGWPRSTNISTSADNLFKTDENEVHETYDGGSIIRSTSFTSLNQ